MSIPTADVPLADLLAQFRRELRLHGWTVRDLEIDGSPLTPPERQLLQWSDTDQLSPEQAARLRVLLTNCTVNGERVLSRPRPVPGPVANKAASAPQPAPRPAAAVPSSAAQPASASGRPSLARRRSDFVRALGAAERSVAELTWLGEPLSESDQRLLTKGAGNNKGWRWRLTMLLRECQLDGRLATERLLIAWGLDDDLSKQLAAFKAALRDAGGTVEELEYEGVPISEVQLSFLQRDNARDLLPKYRPTLEGLLTGCTYKGLQVLSDSTTGS